MPHISQIKDKTAFNLARVEMPDDGYHNAIRDAAKILLMEGNIDYIYFGSTSAVLWASPEDPDMVIRSITFNALSRYQRHLEVISEYPDDTDY